jgi:MbtH protein
MVEHEMEDTAIYQVVVNHEEQYAIWPADCEIPLGWTDAGRRDQD